jgi:methyl-accepting chemotaxis protein
MRKLTLKMKLGMGFGSLLLILVAMGFVANGTVSRLADLSGRVDGMMTKKDTASQIEAEIEKQTTGIRGFLLTGREDLLKIDDQGRREFNENMDRLQKTIATEEGKQFHTDIQRAFDEYRAIADREIELRRAEKTKEAVELAFSPPTGEVRAHLRKAVADFNALEERLKDGLLAEQTSSESHARSVIWILAAVGIGIGLAVAGLITHSITGAISKMAVMIQKISGNDLTVHDLEIISQDEIGRASVALNLMKNNLHGVIQSISGSAMQVASQQITANSEETSAQAKVVSDATAQVSQNLQTVATSAEEMSASAKEIAKNATEAAKVATSAVKVAGNQQDRRQARRKQHRDRQGHQGHHQHRPADQPAGVERDH